MPDPDPSVIVLTYISALEHERSTDLVGGTGGRRRVELLRIEREAEGCLYAGSESLCVTKGEDTTVVDLGLDESGRIKISLGANLELDAIRGPGSIIYGLTTGLNVTRDTVIVARGVLLELVCREEGNSVFGCAESSRRGVVGQGAGGDVVRGLGTKDETVIAHDSVGGDLGAIKKVNVGTAVQARQFVDRSQDRRLAYAFTGIGQKSRRERELQTLCKLVVKLDISDKVVLVVPRLGDGEPVFAVGVFSLEKSADVGGVVGLRARSPEGDVGGCDSLNLEVSEARGEVFAQEIVGRLAKILP